MKKITKKLKTKNRSNEIFIFNSTPILKFYGFKSSKSNSATRKRGRYF